MPKIKDLLAAILLYFLSIFATVFGSYLVYEKVFVAIELGATVQRVGLVERSSEPWSFWIWVLMYGLFGALIAIGGMSLFVWLTRLAIKGGLSDDP